MVDVSEKLLDNCKKWLIAQQAHFTGGVCLGKSIWIEGDEVGKYITEPHSACHSWLVRDFAKACHNGSYLQTTSTWAIPFSKDAKNFLTLNCVRYKKEMQKSITFLVKWMARESPFSEFVLNRDDDESLEKGGVVLLCGPGALTVTQASWICKILRFPTEGGKASETFMTLVEGGVDGMLALYIASNVRTITGGMFGFTGVDSHSTVFSLPSYAYSRHGKYKNNDVKALLKRHMNPEATGTGDLFAGIDPEIDPLPTVKGFCKPFKKSDGWGGHITGEGVDGAELVARALAWQAELLGEEVPSIPVDTSGIYLEVDL